MRRPESATANNNGRGSSETTAAEYEAHKLANRQREHPCPGRDVWMETTSSTRKTALSQIPGQRCLRERGETSSRSHMPGEPREGHVTAWMSASELRESSVPGVDV